MPERTTSYGLALTRSPQDPAWVRVVLRKHFWSVGAGTRSRQVAWTTFCTTGMSEADVLEGALREMLRTLADEMA